MKRIFENLKVIKSDNFDEILSNIDIELPFDRDFINLLKDENDFPQEYYYITNKHSFAFFILYKMKLNIFTLGKLKFDMNVKVIGIPCSVSDKGYYTNDVRMMTSFIKSMKGAKIILNSDEILHDKDMIDGQTLPTLIFDNHFKKIEDYLNALRSNYRRRIKKAIQNCKNFEVEVSDSICPDEVYELYLSTYNKSNYKLEKLNKGFFDHIKGKKIIFSSKDGHARGFVLIVHKTTALDFLFCGMDYNFETTDLYYYMLFEIIKYAIENNIKIINFGQTSEETKMKMGASLSNRYFYAHHSNAIVNRFIKLIKNFLEYKQDFKSFRVFK